MRRFHSHLVVALLGSLTVGLGCQAAPAATPAAAEPAAAPIGTSTRLQYLDTRAKRYVTVLRHRVERTDGGQLRLKVLLRNEYKKDAWVTTKCVFLDGDGFEVESTNNEPLFLPSKRDTSYIVTSLGTAVASYTVYIDNWAYSRDATMPGTR